MIVVVPMIRNGDDNDDYDAAPRSSLPSSFSPSLSAETSLGDSDKDEALAVAWPLLCFDDNPPVTVSEPVPPPADNMALCRLLPEENRDAAILPSELHEVMANAGARARAVPEASDSVDEAEARKPDTMALGARNGASHTADNNGFCAMWRRTASADSLQTTASAALRRAAASMALGA